MVGIEGRLSGIDEKISKGIIRRALASGPALWPLKEQLEYEMGYGYG